MDRQKEREKERLGSIERNIDKERGKKHRQSQKERRRGK